MRFKTVNSKLLLLFMFSGENNLLLNGILTGKSSVPAFTENICDFFLYVVKFLSISCCSASVFFVLCQLCVFPCVVEMAC